MALLRSTAGRPMLSQGGAPLLTAPLSSANVQPPPAEPAAPAGWSQVFFDDFPGTSLDTSKWQIVYGGSVTPNGMMSWDRSGVIVNNGLTIRVYNASGQWRGGGVQQGNNVTGFAGYGDMQVTVKARFPKGQGVGAYIDLWPVDDSFPPEMSVIETPFRDKDRALVTWHWPGNNTGSSATYYLDLTADHIYTIRRTGNVWNYWIDGVEQAVPADWAQNPDGRAMAVGLAGFVASSGDQWYGGAPDSTTPPTWDARIAYVRVHTPGGSTGGGTTGGGGGTTTPAPSTGVAKVRRFVSDLRVGVNIERGESVWNGWITSDRLKEFKSQGCTHVRFFPPVGGNYSIPSDITQVNWLFDAAERAMGAGLKVLVDLLDVMDRDAMKDSRVQPYLSAAAAAIAGRGWDTARYALGAAQEYAYYTNAEHEAERLRSLATLRAKLPDAILLSAGAYWNDPWTLINGSYNPGPDAQVLHQWHAYANDANQVSSAQNIQTNVGAWAERNGLVTICGEWGKGPADGSQEPSYSFTPAVIDAACKGMWQQCPTIWTVTGGSYWRLNQDGTAALRSEVATAIANGSNYVAGLQAYKDRVSAAGTAAGGATTPAPSVSIALSPQSPGTLTEPVAGQGAQAAFTVTTTGLTSFVWVVVRSDYTWREPRQTVSTSGSATVNATFLATGDFLKVLSPDLSISKDSGQVTLAAPAGTGTGTTTGGGGTTTPAQPATALARARAMVAPLTMGVNIERGETIWNGWVTDAFLNEIKGQGLTHIRLFPPSGGSYPLMSQDQLGNFYDVAKKASDTYGFTVLLDLMDVIDEQFLSDPSVETYIGACGDSIASRGLSATKVMVGVCNEYGAGSNQGYEGNREKLLNVLHGKLPNHVLLTASANWNDAWTLINGTMKVYPDKPRVHQWHAYPNDAGSVASAQNFQTNLANWADANQAVTINGEWGIGPPDGQNATYYSAFPDHIKAAYTGMGQQRPTPWTITNGSYWRLNQGGTASFRPEIATAMKAGNTYIRGQTWYTSGLSGGGTGGGTTATTPTPGTTGGGTTGAPIAISISPTDPGALVQASAGVGATKAFTVTTTGLTSIVFVVVKADYSWRDSVTVPTTGTVSISPVFYATGDFLKVLSPDYTVFKDSGAATVTTGTGSTTGSGAATGGAAPTISIAPQSPGTLTEAVAGQGATKQLTVTTTGLSSFVWVVVKADFSWREPRQTVQTTGTATITPTYYATGDFVKVLTPDLASWKDGGQAVVAAAPAGGSTGTAPGGTAAKIDLLVRGQSNAYLADSYGATGAMRDTLAALTGVSVNLIARRDGATGDNTLHSSTSTAWVDPYDNSFGYWLTVPGANYDGPSNRAAINYASDPATWASNTPLSETLAAVSRFKTADASSVFVDFRLHWEYDLVMYNGAENTYRAFAWEATNRIKAAAAKAAGRHFVAYGHCPYVGKTIRALDPIAAAWEADRAGRDVMLASNMMDATTLDGGSHWNSDGPLRSFPRAAFQVAKKLWDAGVLPGTFDLSDAPTLGPRIASIARTGSNTLAVTVAHDKGTALVAQSGTTDWSAFTWYNGSNFGDATGGSISGSTINLTFPGAIASTGNERLNYCGWPHFRGAGLITDNWHTIRPAKYGNVPNIGSVVFPLRRTLPGVAF